MTFLISPIAGGLTPVITMICKPVKSESLNISVNWAVANDTTIIDTIQEYRLKLTSTGGAENDIVIGNMVPS